MLHWLPQWPNCTPPWTHSLFQMLAGFRSIANPVLWTGQTKLNCSSPWFVLWSSLHLPLQEKGHCFPELLSLSQPLLSFHRSQGFVKRPQRRDESHSCLKTHRGAVSACRCPLQAPGNILKIPQRYSFTGWEKTWLTADEFSASGQIPKTFQSSYCSGTSTSVKLKMLVRVHSGKGEESQERCGVDKQERHIC